MAEDFINRMFHWVTNALLVDLDEPAEQHQSFVRSLLQLQSLGRAMPGVARPLVKWRLSADGEDVRPQLMMQEPVGFEGQLEDLPDMDLPQLLESQDRADGEGGSAIRFDPRSAAVEHEVL